MVLSRLSECELPSISSTFYTHVFCTKVLCAAFLKSQFGFVTFWRKNNGAKAARKILRAHFAPIFLRQIFLTQNTAF